MYYFITSVFIVLFMSDYQCNFFRLFNHRIGSRRCRGGLRSIRPDRSRERPERRTRSTSRSCCSRRSGVCSSRPDKGSPHHSSSCLFASGKPQEQWPIGKYICKDVCMYVCIEVTLCGIAHGIGHPTGPGGGAHQKSGSNFPNPRVPSVPRHACWLILAHLVCFL